MFLISILKNSSAMKQITNNRNKVPNFVDLNKVFEVPPYSQSVTLGKQVEIRCHPPKGKPRPRVIKHLARQLSPIQVGLFLQIYWMKNKMEIQVERDSNFLQSADGHLIIVQVREQDMGNYTCVAENLINRRISPPARLDIFGKKITFVIMAADQTKHRQAFTLSGRWMVKLVAVDRLRC